MWALSQLFQLRETWSWEHRGRLPPGPNALPLSAAGSGTTPPGIRSLLDPLIWGRSLGPEAPDWPYPGRSPSPPLDGGERSAAGRCAGSTMAGLWVGTVAAGRHWRRPPQQLLWTLKVSNAGLACKGLAAPGSQATPAVHPDCPRPRIRAGCAHTLSWHGHRAPRALA